MCAQHCCALHLAAHPRYAAHSCHGPKWRSPLFVRTTFPICPAPTSLSLLWRVAVRLGRCQQAGCAIHTKGPPRRVCRRTQAPSPLPMYSWLHEHGTRGRGDGNALVTTRLACPLPMQAYSRPSHGSCAPGFEAGRCLLTVGDAGLVSRAHGGAPAPTVGSADSAACCWWCRLCSHSAHTRPTKVNMVSRSTYTLPSGACRLGILRGRTPAPLAPLLLAPLSLPGTHITLHCRALPLQFKALQRGSPQLAGRVGCTHLPGSHEVFNPLTGGRCPAA